MTADSSDRDAIELLMKLADLARVLRAIGRDIDTAVDASLGGRFVNDNVSIVVVCNLVISGPLRPSDIAGFTGLTSGGVTKVLTRLEDAGMVTRSYGMFPDDRRGVSIALTEAGQAFAQTYGTMLQERIADEPVLTEQIRGLLAVD